MMSLVTKRPHTCLRCAVREGLARRLLATPAPAGRFHGAEASKLSRTYNRHLATVHQPTDGTGLSTDGPSRPLAVQATIRDRLRQWERDNPGEAVVGLKDEDNRWDSLVNRLTRGETGHLIDNAAGDVAEDNGPLIETGEAVDYGSGNAPLDPGDLIEISTESKRVPLLAVCLTFSDGIYHFYTNTGKWFTSRGVRTLFVVKSFALESELLPVISSLPPVDTSAEVLDVLQKLGEGPTRDVGAALMQKMTLFTAESSRIHQEHVARLECAIEKVAGPHERKYLTLQEIAQHLFPKGSYLLDGQTERLKPAALYAVHRALLEDDASFRPVSWSTHRRSFMFEVSSLDEVNLIDEVEHTMRQVVNWNENKPNKKLQQTVRQVGDFIDKARKAIDVSRTRRQWSSCGIIGPSRTETPSAAEAEEWSSSDRKLIKFMELWAACGKITRASRLHWVGAALLRRLQRYDEAVFLGPSTGWTFLQEIGWITPWDIQARYSLCLPGVALKRPSGFQRTPPPVELAEDIFAAGRKDWGDAKVYCIDAESTTDIDDGMSLERTDSPGEYWIHVHVADPASRIRPDSPLAKHAELVPQTVYLPGHFERMFADASVKEAFSLAPDRPCLTFSAKVNDEGTLLDQKITPGTVRKVIYITGEEVSKLCSEPEPPPVPTTETFAVGEPSSLDYPPNRRMTTAADLSQDELEELRTLHRLNAARQGLRLQQGAMPLYWPRPQARVSFSQVAAQTLTSDTAHWSGDPYIEVSYGDGSCGLVGNAMCLAGEVAARWCAARSVPIPYRSQPQAARNRAALEQLTREVLYPELRAGRRPGEDALRAMRNLVGVDETTTEPGPHFTIGVDLYTKATSPLRRYCDLLVHWQVGAALAEERRRGDSLIGLAPADVEAALPFSRARLDRDVLPLLRLRERLGRALDRVEGIDEWILQALVRAWRFGEADSSAAAAGLPAAFRFAVSDVLPRRAARGRLDWFDRPATLDVDGLDGLDGLRLGDIGVGDVLEVVLRDVNVHTRQIVVAATRLVERAGV